MASGRHDEGFGAEPWFALKTQPRREAQVGHFLNELSVQTYVPEVSVGIRAGRAVFEPLFPTYLFFRVDAGSSLWPIIRWSPGSRHIVSFGDEPATVPPELLQHISDRVTRRSNHSGDHVFRHGDCVAVAGGPFAGFNGVFDGTTSGAQRAHILIEFLGRLVSAHVPLENLRRQI